MHPRRELPTGRVASPVGSAGSQYQVEHSPGWGGGEKVGKSGWGGGRPYHVNKVVGLF